MAYIPVNHDSRSSSSKYLITPSDLSGGLAVTGNTADIPASCQPSLLNVYYSDGRLTTRGGLREICGGTITGTFHSNFSEEFYGNIFFHTGTGLYRFDGENVHCLSNTVSDTSSFFYRMNNKLCFVTSGRKAYEISDEFVFSEIRPYIPVVAKCKDNYSTLYDTVEPFNLMTRRVKCSFTIETATSPQNFLVPFKVDAKERIYAFINNSLASSATALFDESNIRVSLPLSVKTGDTLYIEFAITGEEEKFEEYFSKIYENKVAVTFGGSTEGGTRVFLTGNEKYPGAYFRSELKEPFYFPDTNEETLGDGGENVTCAAKRYDRLFMFTRNHIYAVDYSFSSESGASFPVDEISTSIGCDMRKSTALIDNTLVFGNSTEGVYILESTDIFNEINVKPLAGNILGSYTEYDGTFALADGKYSACDFDRKYFIFTGKDLYIWDYGRTPFYNSDNYSKAQMRLAWYKYSGFENCAALIKFKDKLYSIFERDGNTRLVLYDKDAAYDSFYNKDTGEYQKTAIESSFSTKDFDFGAGYTKKKLTEIYFDAELPDDDSLFTVKFFGDGNEYYSYRLSGKNSGKLKIKLPPCLADNFSVSFETKGGRMKISNLVFCYKLCGRVKNYSRKSH